MSGGDNISIHSNHLDQIKVGEPRVKFNRYGEPLRFYMDFNDHALGLFREISAPDIRILQNKIDALMEGWDQKYLMQEEREQRKLSEEEAAAETREQEALREQLANILQDTLSVDDAVDWDVLKDNRQFDFRDPARGGSDELAQEFPEQRPSPPPVPRMLPRPEPSLWQRISGKADRMLREYREQCAEREDQVRRIANEHREQTLAWKERKAAFEADIQTRRDAAQRAFVERQEAVNAKVDDLRERWQSADPAAIEEHAAIVLENSDYRGLVEKSFDLSFLQEERLMLIEFQLPAPDDLPLVKTVRYIKSTGQRKETLLAQKEQRALYDSVCYQICLRTIHELFEADTPGHVKKVAFNGVIHFTDKATGHPTNATILSVVTDRETFEKIDLRNVDPKACFKSLKGVSAASLVGMTPVQPIVKLDTDDRRFVEGREVLDDEIATNLAAMDWEEFEHLVRELFEREFMERGGEVKVTQSSRDGGVDAVAFDPDPITGGKIVIQAKRYTNTVGVGAVRDLYGTTMNEGASKGILVTTSDYGSDAHRFASDKPITLLSGSHLLHLLEKHGIKAKIDLAAAKRELRARE